MGRKIFYIALEGKSAGMPTCNPEGIHRIADGSKIDRDEYPEAARLVETYFDQKRYIAIGYGKAALRCIHYWNKLVFKLADFDPRFITWHKSTTMANPEFCEGYVTLPDWRLVDDLSLLLKAATYVTTKLEPRGLDFE